VAEHRVLVELRDRAVAQTPEHKAQVAQGVIRQVRPAVEVITVVGLPTLLVEAVVLVGPLVASSLLRPVRTTEMVLQP
jgi:hypothetical protein